MSLATMRKSMWAAAVAASMVVAPQAHAERISFIVPAQIIYPGQPIADASLREKIFSIKSSAASNYVLSRDQITGKIARKTLLPGQPILAAAVNEPDLIRRGVAVPIVYDTGSLVITAKGVSMEPGRAGDYVKVRNVDSGLIVSGTVMADGSIQVGLQ
ncbi:flagellar basal body P-ring formation chaperone FlgA [Phyllobacterium sp. 21LDTY02-6]|uniref:flagellar basal body P-ring formation chaperone FlgA n=1 Tax=Phyllobacterium sp. 21LDTY02-6 TaxID=2944903 RepID=UPI0020221044|nr:flagellar basal body P-ring formation chaperone FlgA [Phyllobacterium sp. 21LDTY02-6]MCO4315652.1 flagellar basal body P-ring formation chaperone FlgA [Phyllobacterium sp. 21LDTY02-6]